MPRPRQIHIQLAFGSQCRLVSLAALAMTPSPLAFLSAMGKAISQRTNTEQLFQSVGIASLAILVTREQMHSLRFLRNLGVPAAETDALLHNATQALADPVKKRPAISQHSKSNHATQHLFCKRSLGSPREGKSLTLQHTNNEKVRLVLARKSTARVWGNWASDPRQALE